MDQDDTYNGWTNRETWAANLHLSNDEGLYLTTLELVASALEGFDPEVDMPKGFRTPEDIARRRISIAADAIREYLDEILDPDENPLMDERFRSMMARDIGSLWRVDWRQVAAHWLPENQ